MYGPPARRRINSQDHKLALCIPLRFRKAREYFPGVSRPVLFDSLWLYRNVFIWIVCQLSEPDLHCKAYFHGTCEGGCNVSPNWIYLLKAVDLCLVTEGDADIGNTERITERRGNANDPGHFEPSEFADDESSFAKTSDGSINAGVSFDLSKYLTAVIVFCSSSSRS